MRNQYTNGEDSLHSLRERAKELNCLYQVDEILSNERWSLAEIFEAIVGIIPSGWQYPQHCEARLVFENASFQTPGYFPSPISETSYIKVNDDVVGRVDVVYTSEVPRSEEGYFLEKERKLIRTITDRIGQSILHRRLKHVLKEWQSTTSQSSQQDHLKREWMIIVDLLRRTDPDMLLHICRKMITYLHWSGIKEAEEIMQDLSPGWKGAYEQGEVNYPTAKLPLGNLATITDKTFHIASRNLSDVEISVRLKKWIQEQKAYHLIRTIDRIDASMGEIVEAIIRYRKTAGDREALYHPTERWLEVALIRRFLSTDLDFIRVAKPYIRISHFYDLAKRLIFPPESHGKIGGKSTGLFLAQHILEKESTHHSALGSIKIPNTWCMTTDEITEFLHYNNLEELNEQKYKELSEIRMDYPNIIQTMKNAKFPPGIIKSLAMALDHFGDSPLIVRSSSLLEDQMGAAFSGKYKSLFLGNRGSKKERLEALMDAIIEVYASVYSPDSIQYRMERGLLDFHEEMGILIQEVVGTQIGPYYLPLYSGVAFSNNEFRWSPRINREDGLIRLVMGLGTRAVDRISDDFPVLISPGQPGLRVNTVPDEIKHYAQRQVDVINLENNTFETIPINTLLQSYGNLTPHIEQIVSIHRREYVIQPNRFDIHYDTDDLVVTFDGLIKETSFIRKVGLILNTLQDKLGTPVDIEFASDGENFYLLQCRPQSFGVNNAPAPIPKDITEKNMIFSAKRYVSNGMIQDISHIVYVDPEGYQNLSDLEDLINVGRVVGMLNTLLPRRRFILMGPGRWGSRGDIKMGVQVTYSDISNTSALIEIARKKAGYLPDLSFGTHFFQDLVESNIRYLPLYPDDADVVYNQRFLTKSKNILSEILPKYEYLESVVRVIDVPANTGGNVLNLAMNADLAEALAYLAGFSGQALRAAAKASDPLESFKKPFVDPLDDQFWRWRFFMAERIAQRLDSFRLGVKAVYLIGSTNNGTAGPGSDIDLVVHFQGSELQHAELLQWLNGWSQCLAELNYLKTGYSTDGLLDIHIITDEDVAKKSSYAMKIDAITDPAYLLKINLEG